MKINEIFLSIEGEGKRTGLPAVFIRTFGCNLSCPYCFGVRTGRNVPRLRLGYVNNDYRGDHNLPISKAQTGQWIMTYDENMNLVETQIVSCTTRNVTSWYEVVINQTTYFITPEHPIFTINGLKRVEELAVGDIIIECDPSKYLTYMGTYRNCMKNADVVKRSVENTDYKKVGMNISKTRKRVFDEIRKLQESNTPQSEWSDECMSYYSAYMTENRMNIDRS